MSKHLEIVFEFEKDTKNTLRYKENTEEGEKPRIGTLYLQKDSVPNPTPQHVRISVNFD